jgi:aldehyde dehydrogenase (NAD+)
MPGQVDVIRRHIDDALNSGGHALTGAVLDGPYVEPTVLTDVPESSAAVREETFGPTLTVTRVRDAEEALSRTNATRYGLAGAVFTGSKERGMDLARRMRSGMTSVNSVITFAAVPALPFGGVGDSGFGRIHGEDGLKEFTRAKSITVQRFALPTPLMTFARNVTLVDSLAKVTGLRHGRR